MAASLSLNDPVVIVTLVRACVAPTGCTEIATNKINGMEKPKSFIFIASSDDLAMWNVPTLMKSLNAVKPERSDHAAVFTSQFFPGDQKNAENYRSEERRVGKE